MDKELIFSYRRRTAHTEPGDADRPSLVYRPFGAEDSGERGTRTGSR